MTEMDDATAKAVGKIQKLLMLAAKAGTEAEAAAATAKAQELLVAYNLDAATVERESGVSGKRLDENVSGGMYKFQQKLWEHIATLNFCMYWTQRVRSKTGVDAKGRRVRTTYEHRLVGRAVNVIATKNMATYINQTINRLCREKLGPDSANQLGSSYMVAFREGIVDRVAEKIADRRRAFLDEEKKKEAAAARRASRAGLSLATTLTVAGLSEREQAANYDFLHGEGAWAKKKADELEWEKGRVERRRRQSAAMAEAERAEAEWARANPEEAAAEEKRERARERRREAYVPRGRWRFRQTKEEMRRESGGYHAGYDAGESVSIEPQVGGGDRRIGRG